MTLPLRLPYSPLQRTNPMTPRGSLFGLALLLAVAACGRAPAPTPAAGAEPGASPTATAATDPSPTHVAAHLRMRIDGVTGIDAQNLERIGALVVQEALRGYPLWTFRPQELPLGLKVQGITIGADVIKVQFE